MKQKLFTFLCLCVLCIGSAWGEIANPYSFTFAKGELNTSSTSYTSGDVTWSMSATENSWNGNAGQTGYIFGSGGSPKTLTISTNDISGTITEVSVTGRSNNSGKTATVSVKVGTTNFTGEATTWNNGNNQALTFTGSASGEIAVTITPNACGYVLAGISVKYTASSGPSISANNVNLAADATSGEISYSISNPVEGKSLTAETSAGWIPNVTVDATNSKVTFTSTPNTETTSREATITLNYGEGTATKDIKVTQAAAPYTTITDLFAKATEVGSAATDVKIKFGDWIVSGVNGTTAYVTDGENGFILYNNAGHGFAVGDIISGTVNAKLNLRNGSANVQGVSTTTDGITKTTGGTLTPREVTIAQLSGVNTGSIITVNNVTYNGTTFTDGANTIKPYTDFFEGSYIKGKKYNMTGMFLQYSTEKEILPRNKDDIYEIPATEYNITIAPSANGAIDANVAKAAEGIEVTLTVTPLDHYALESLTVIDASSNPITVTDNKFTMPASDVTVSATFAEKAKFTVSYYSLGETAGSEDVYDGELIANAPTPTLTGWELIGWTTNDAYETSQTAPVSFDLSTPITGALNLYAVFKKTEGEAPADFDLNVTSGDFTISYDGQYASSAIGSSSTDKISTSANGQSACVYTFTKVSDGVYSIYDKAKGQYLKYKSSTDLGYASEAYNWSISASEKESGCWRIASSTSGRALIYRTSNLFGGYSTSNVTSDGEYHDVNIIGYSTATTYYTTSGILTQDVTISSVGYSTYSSAYALVVPETSVAEVFGAKVNDAGTAVTLIPVEAGTVLEAGTGFIVKGTANTTVEFTVSSEDGEAISGNELLGTGNETLDLTAGDAYLLGAKDGKAVFALCNAGTLGANKACLPATTGANGTLGFDDATGIEFELQDAKSNVVRYNLNGQVVGNDYKGIVIVNGKKFLNK